MKIINVLLLFLSLLGVTVDMAHAQNNKQRELAGDVGLPTVPREFRGVWVASVTHIDWPSAPGLTTQQQQSELIAILDKAVQLKLNAVVLQVRPACDALYDSKLEPWSEFLTGKRGQPPNPYYDPLTFAVDEAHKRGLELHAWFNPYRAGVYPAGVEPDKSSQAPNHISNTHPEIVRRYGTFLWLDPGESLTMEHSLAVIRDMVRRYDIDGIHYDDYFYPYKIKDKNEKIVDFPDEPSWQKYVQGGGKLSRDDWRRQNVNTFVQRIYSEVKAIKKTVKVGISPFGIWRPGYPASIKGLDQYSDLYADAKLWLNNGWLDYWTPQLYWKIEAPAQSYPVLLKWWVEQNTHGRNLWPGNFTSKVAYGGKDKEGKSLNWPAEEIPNQILATRAQTGATGNVHFSMKMLMPPNTQFADMLAKGVYAAPALVPASPWLDNTPPAQPTLRVARNQAMSTHEASWTAGSAEQVWQWVLQSLHGNTWTTEILSGTTFSKRWSRDPAAGEGAHNPRLPDMVALSAIDRCGNQSKATILQIRSE